MDKASQKAFMKNLAWKEQFSFGITEAHYFSELPKAEKQAYYQARIDMLTRKVKKTLEDKMELATLPATRDHVDAKIIKTQDVKGIKKKVLEVTSPYLIRPPQKRI